MRLLLTNDDGIHSPGLHALARHLCSAGHDVVVAAPALDMSGSSAAIGRLHTDEHIEVTDVEIPGANGLRGLAVAGPPGLAAMAACLGGFGDPPDVVMSGINTGLNTGHSILHSGTVGATLTAQNFGRCGVAVSIQPTEPWYWETACKYASIALAWLADRAPTRTVVNVNVPGRPDEDIQGIRWAKLDQFGSVRAAVADQGREGLQFEFRATGAELDPESDTYLVDAGYVALTALQGVTEISIADREIPGIDPAQVTRELRRADHLRVNCEPSSRLPAGAGLGSAGFIVYDETCTLAVARLFSRFASVESCGQCPPCTLQSSVGTDSVVTPAASGQRPAAPRPPVEWVSSPSASGNADTVLTTPTDIPPGLAFADDRDAGIRRRRAGKGFVYIGPNGRKLDPATIARIRALAVPPAWTDVWICVDDCGHIQATGRDARGRKQYRYHQQFRAHRESAKFTRLYDFGRALPAIRRQVATDLTAPGIPREKVIATVIRLLEATLVRVGNEEYARTNKSYGLTTFRDRHAQFSSDGLKLVFKGKHGIAASVKVQDRRLRRVVKQCQDLPGQVLFQYVGDDGDSVSGLLDRCERVPPRCHTHGRHRQGLPDLDGNAARGGCVRGSPRPHDRTHGEAIRQPRPRSRLESPGEHSGGVSRELRAPAGDRLVRRWDALGPMGPRTTREATGCCCSRNGSSSPSSVRRAAGVSAHARRRDRHRFGVHPARSWDQSERACNLNQPR